MTVILKNFGFEKVVSRILDNKIVKNIINNKAVEKIGYIVKEKRVLVKALSLSVIGISALLISFAATGITFGYNVVYSGKVISTVKNAAILKSARTIAIDSVEGKDVESVISPANLRLTLTVSDKLENAKSLANSMIDNTDDIISGASLFINGQEIACLDAVTLKNMVEEKRTAYYIEGAENTASFVDDVKIVDNIFLACELDNAENVKLVVDSLQVKTISTLTRDISIPYSTKKVYSDKYAKGYSKVTTAGVNGVSRKTETIVNVNGSEVSRVENSNIILSSPVTKVTTIGTAAVTISATEKANISSAGFICPISKGKYTVTSWWGDGRNHKALDLAASRGTAIFAVASGTVVESTRKSDYGYYVMIDHGNGLKTRYAHCDALAVRVGQKVSQGDMIATVGNTGRSSGPHLHFEVYVNGNRVNPAPYIGLNK